MGSNDFDAWEEERKRKHAEREARRAERRRERERGDNPEGERKERVLHTRISYSLDDAIRKAADELRVPVSNLVRNVLEDVFEVVESVTDNVGDLVDDVLGESERARARMRRHGARRRRARRHRFHAEVEMEPEEAGGAAAEAEPEGEVEPERPRREFPDVVGWQPIILNAGRACSDCTRHIQRGDRAFVGLTQSGLSDAYLCALCTEARR